MTLLPRLCIALACATCCSASALDPEDVIINEVYFYTRGGGATHHEAVELLVVKDHSDLNSLIISDRDLWNYRGFEDQGIVQDLGQRFLSDVRSGTLIVLYNGSGTDDIDPKDFVLRLYAKSSLFCNLAPTSDLFKLHDGGDNLHLLHSDQQIDFVKYRASDFPTQGKGDPFSAGWEKGINGFVDIGPKGESVGMRFLGDKPDLNDYLATWQSYSETYLANNNLGKPNGGRNTTWIESLRKGTQTKTPDSPQPKVPPSESTEP